MSLFRAPMKTIMAGLIPFIAVSLVALALTTYVPDITLWLPKMLYPKSFH
jgi:C4-dicarboxylate transporter DctM subunit